MNTRREEALAQGYKDETCSRCGTLFEAHIHFIRCDARPCPMIPDGAKTLLERALDEFR